MPHIYLIVTNPADANWEVIETDETLTSCPAGPIRYERTRFIPAAAIIAQCDPIQVISINNAKTTAYPVRVQ